MRSRLEAGFAQLLDRNNLNWSYESRAFASQAGQYLPDFEVFDGGHPWFFEVKPEGHGTISVLDRMKIILGTHPHARLQVFEGSWSNGEYRYELAQQWPPPKPPKPYFIYIVPGCDSWHDLPWLTDWLADSLAEDGVTEEAAICAAIADELADVDEWNERRPKVYVLPDNDNGRGVLVHAVAFHKGDACLVSQIPLPWLTDYLVGQTTR